MLNLPFVLTLDKWLEPALGHAAHPSVPARIVRDVGQHHPQLFWPDHGLGALHSRGAAGRRGSAGSLVSCGRCWITNGTWIRCYDRAIVRPLNAVSTWFARFFDPKIIDGAVNGVGQVCIDAGEYVRKLQNGAVPTYAFSILLGVVAVLLYFVFIG